MLFDFVRASYDSPRTACTDLSRRLRDGVSLLLVEVINPFISTHGMAAVSGRPYLIDPAQPFHSEQSVRSLRKYSVFSCIECNIALSS